MINSDPLEPKTLPEVKPWLRDCPECESGQVERTFTGDGGRVLYFVRCRWCSTTGPDDPDKVNACRYWNAMPRRVGAEAPTLAQDAPQAPECPEVPQEVPSVTTGPPAPKANKPRPKPRKRRW